MAAGDVLTAFHSNWLAGLYFGHIRLGMFLGCPVLVSRSSALGSETIFSACVILGHLFLLNSSTGII